MAKSLSSILSQIERLQKEAANIQSEVISRIRKDIAKYGLTAEQLFGATSAAKPRRPKAVAMPSKAAKTAKTAKPPKYADGAGNTWGGMGKRPEWIRQALAAGQALEDFLIANGQTSAPAKVKSTLRRRSTPLAAPTPKDATQKRPAKASAPRRSRAKAAPATDV